MAEGLGTGFGLMFSSLSDKLRQVVYHKVEFDYSFAKGLGRGLGIILPSVSEDLQVRALDLAQGNSSLAVGIGYGLAEAFCLSSDFGISNMLLNKAIQISEVCKGFGFAMAHSFPELASERQLSILGQLLPHKPVIAKFASHGLGHVFSLLTSDLQGKLMQLAESEDESFGRGLGYGLGHSFKNLDEVIQNELFSLALNNKDSQFALGLGFGVGRAFPSLSETVQKRILEKLPGDNCRLVYGVSFGLSQSVNYLDKDMRDRIMNFATTNTLVYKQKADPLDSNTMTDFLIDGYEDFPLPRYLSERFYEVQSWAARRNDDQEVSFTGIRQSYCVCYIDMMDSTNIASQLKQNELGKYYSIFLNATAAIARNFGANIIKNAGDCLIYYFPNTSNINDNSDALKDVIECGITMISAHGIINAKLHEEKLPSLNYRISADYGTVELAKSKSSQTEDLFGSAMNHCAKINSKAPSNGMVVGETFYHLVKSLNGYKFTKVEDPNNSKHTFPAYRLEITDKRTILNPFKRGSEFKSP